MVQLRNSFSCETDKMEVTNKMSIKEVSLVVYLGPLLPEILEQANF